MRILISGLSGFVGKHLSTKLLQEGHELVGLSRNPKHMLATSSMPIEWHSWESTTIRDIDCVIHLAGESVASGRWTKKRKEELLRSRTKTTEQLFSLCKNCLGRKPKIFLGASAIGFYGDQGDTTLSECSPKGDSFLSSICNEWEGRSLDFHDLGIRTIIFRIGIVLGRDGGALQQMLPIFKLGVGAPLGNGKQWMSWIHIDDLVNIFSWAIKNEDVNGIYNAVAPSPVTNREFSKTLATMLSSPLFPSVPAVVLKLAMGEMSEIVLASQKVSAEKLQKSGFHFQYSNLKNAISALLQSVEGIYGRFADVFFTQQWLPHPVEKVFPFYSEAKNLERITPEFLQFRILSQSTPQIEKNSEFTYRLKVHGIPLFWRTKILEWEPNVKFVDNQESGPYSRWHHTHIFQSISNGTLISDRVVYKLPLGFLGYLIASRFVARDVAQIFGYRQKVVNAIFQK